ncbi:MAG: SPOR domain-containing protein [candidate division Zixibacteria bacterium]|nr:SPOR domain-containing protein [candidate division Zixibacteria bacterium]
MTGRSTYSRNLIFASVTALLMAVGLPLEAKDAKEKNSPKPTEQKVRTVDPLGYPQDTIPYSTKLGVASSTRSRLIPVAKMFESGDSLASDSLGAQIFRVQLAMIDTYSDARHALAVAHEIFDQPVSLDYETPYYKLRVGEFTTRGEAELYQQRARGAGYTNAWVMVATVTPKQAEPLYQANDSTAVQKPR